jgi:hypothetical protein
MQQLASRPAGRSCKQPAAPPLARAVQTHPPYPPTPQGYGNGALALLFTVAGNVTGIVTAPLMVKAVLGSLTNAKIDSLDLLVKLGVSILMPVLVGKATREAVPLIRCGGRRGGEAAGGSSAAVGGLRLAWPRLRVQPLGCPHNTIPPTH